MTYVPSSTGRLSELAERKQRADWSKVNQQIRALQPGELLKLSCPSSISMASFRSTVLTAGKRIHRNEWGLSTRTEGKKLLCFLAPR